jgi:hypothetical protein
MADMTNNEYDALDELWTLNTPKVDWSRPGVFARQRALLDALDSVAATYIHSRAEAEHRTPAQIIGILVRKEIAASA